MVAIVRVVAEFLGAILYYTRPVSEVLIYFIYLLFMGKTKPLPPIKNEILLLSALEVAEKIRKRQLKCEDVVKVYIERAKEVQPYINAIVDDRYAEALKEAKEVDHFIESGQKSSEEIERETPLLGVPFTCKESIGVKGLAQTAGILCVKGRVADKDSDAANLYRSAGAIPVTVTNVPEMCMWWDSSNLIFGICRNPYDNHRTVGGSTGGEAALLTTAGAIIGIGNDIGGSIRMPASFNGIYGHKPSSGIRTSRTSIRELKLSSIVSNAGDFPDMGEEEEKVRHFVSTGPMCRYANDLPLLFKILSGNDSRLQLDKKVDFHHVKIYYMEEFPGISAIPPVKKSVRKAVKYFEEHYGVKGIPLRLDEMKYAFNIWESKVLETNIPPFKAGMADENGKINLWWELFKSIFRCSTHTFPVIFYAMIDKRDKDQLYYDCLKKYDSLERKLNKAFEEDAILLMPTHPELPPFYHLTVPKFLNISYTMIYNVLGLPSTNIPAGFYDGLPMGLQAISGKFKDHLTIAAALELDKCFGGWKGPSKIEIS